MDMRLDALALASGGARWEGPDDSAGAASLLDWKRRRCVMMEDEQVPAAIRAQVSRPPTGGKGWQTTNSHPSKVTMAIIPTETVSEDTELWTVKEVAKFLDVEERKVWNLLRRARHSHRGLPSVRMDGKPRFLPSEVRRWKEAFGTTLRKLSPKEEYERWQETRRQLRSTKCLDS